MQLDTITLSSVRSVDKYYRLIAVMRSRVAALLKSGSPDVSSDVTHIELLIERFVSAYRVQVSLDDVYNDVYNEFVSAYGLTIKDHLSRYCVPKRKYVSNNGNFLNRLVNMYENSNFKSACQSWIFRINEECRLAVERGDYLIFDTLTVTGDKFHEVFGSGSKSWRYYIQRFSRLVNGVHRYVAVPDYGDLGRLHVHVLHFCSKPPFGCSDPNRGLKVPNRREFSALKSLWSFGFSAPRPVRLHANDVWAKLGYRWPYVDCNPLPCSSVFAVSGYLGNYLFKNYNREGGILWRIKATRNLGLIEMTEKLSRLTVKDLYALTTYQAPFLLKILRRTVPRKIMVSVVMKVLQKKLMGNLVIRNLILMQKTKESLIERLQTLIHRLQTRCNFRNIGESSNHPQALIFDSIFRPGYSLHYYLALSKLKSMFDLDSTKYRMVNTGSICDY